MNINYKPKDVCIYYTYTIHSRRTPGRASFFSIGRWKKIHLCVKLLGVILIHRHYLIFLLASLIN